MSEQSTAAIILAAGASTRLGQPKQLIQLAGETLIDRAVRTAREANCSPILVVLGAGLPGIITQSRLEGAIKVINSNWREGMATSIVRGVQILNSIAPNTSGAILMTCDQPTVTPEHLQALAAGQPTASAYANRLGVPAWFPRTSFPSLLELTGDHGARDLLNNARAIELPGGELDIDTAVDLEAARAALS
jgi:CTP:molybdopterin cytidylyltransferase MocA